MNIKISLLAICVCLIGFTQAQGELTYTVTDLGTLGGNTTTANNVTGHGQNAAGMIVGSSTTSDNSEHAFLYVRDKMYDLNTLCDLSQSEFKVLTVARTISDSCVIIGDGITKNGDKHAFKMTPIEVAGGQWQYDCCQWIWKQDGGGWWWEEGCGCYKWHGPPGKHPPCPPQPPPCWNWPLPCCPGCPPPPPTTPTPTPPRETPTPTSTPPVRRTPTPPNWTPTPTPTPTYTGVPVGVLPTPTPAAPALGLRPIIRPVSPTPTPSRKRGKQSPTSKVYLAKPAGQATATPSNRGAPSRKKKRTGPSPTPAVR